MYIFTDSDATEAPEPRETPVEALAAQVAALNAFSLILGVVLTIALSS